MTLPKTPRKIHRQIQTHDRNHTKNHPHRRSSRVLIRSHRSNHVPQTRVVARRRRGIKQNPHVPRHDRIIPTRAYILHVLFTNEHHAARHVH
jgi:hypothetical protein